MTVVHAAAGGPGQKLTQPVKARGGTVIGIVSGERKAGTARRAGADRTVVSTGDAFAEPVLELTGGVGADVVLDGGGATTFHASMNVLRRHGLLLYYGPFIGEVPVVTMRDLPRRIKISYPVFSDHVPTREALLRPSAELFGPCPVRWPPWRPTPARTCSGWPRPPCR